MSNGVYKDLLDTAIKDYKNNYLTPLASFEQLPVPPKELVDLIAYEKQIASNINTLRSVNIPMLQFDPTTSVREHYNALNIEVESKREQLNQLLKDQTQAIEDQHNKEIEEAREYNEHLADPYKTKHKQLLAMNKELRVIFAMYDITPLDLKISDNITEKEFNTLIDQSIAVCKKYISKSNQMYNRIINPLKGNKNLGFTAAYSLMLAIGAYISLPFAAIYLVYKFLSSTHNMYKDMEKLRIACALMTEIDYKRFISEDQFKVVGALDVSEVQNQVQEALDSLEDYTEEAATALQEAQTDSEVRDALVQAQAEVKSQYNEVIDNMQAIYNAVHAKVEEEVAKLRLFPTVQKDSVVMDHYYVLGRVEGRIDDFTEFPLKNMIFSSKNRDVAINTMKLYLANALLSVRVKQLTVEIYDPKNMCGEFSEFFTPETKPYIRANDMTLDDLLKTYKQYSQDNILVLDNKDIDAYNREAEAKEMVPKAYKLLLIISGFDKLKKGEDEQLWVEYMKFSASSGVMIWLLDNKEYPNTIFIDGSYTGPGEAIKYSRDLGKQAVQTYINALENYKDRGIDYTTKFADVFIPRDKWWTWDTIKGIELNYGLENGDPTRGFPISLGDANVHALLGGATGSGKSATINQMLISLITKYPPSELQIIYIDFKNVEAAKFARGYVLSENRWMTPEEEKECLDNDRYYTRISRIPHLRIISGTTDGEYALSVFEFLMAEMSRRQSIINKAGVTKIQDLRENILNDYNREHGTPGGTWHDMRSNWEWYKPNVYDQCGDLPRVLVIFDEFQQMFNPEYVEDRVIQQITGKINALTKLARAMACHLWFTSQDMKGTLSKSTISNFSLRGALRCGEEASFELLGNKAASTITAKQGYMYTNDSGGTDKDANKFWRIPFLKTEKMMEYIEEVNDMLEANHETHLMAELYDEKTLPPGTLVDEWYAKYPDLFNNPSTIILGERANFSTNKAPVAFNLMNDTGEHLLLAAFDQNDLLNLVETIINNVKDKGDNAQILVNVQDKDTYKLLDIDNVNPEKFRPLGMPSQDISEFVDALNSMVDLRYEKGGPYSQLFVFCIQWERAPYISVDVNYKVQDKFKDLLRKAPNVGVHFVFASRERLEMPRSIPAACKHRIAGLLPKDSMFFIESQKVEKLPDPSKKAGIFALYEYGSSLVKLKIYQYTYTAEIESREIIID